jgi:HAD superfamily hydrolase (TIGR01509 family)
LHELPEVSVNLKGIFKETYSVGSLTLDKKQPGTYRALANHAGVKPAEITFVDDKLANVTAAREAGIDAIQYTSNDALIKALDGRLVS